MRIEVLGKVYGYYYRKDDEVVFKAAPKREYRDGKLLKEARAKNGWSQKDVADVLEVSQSMVAKYETGERIPSGRAAAGVSQLLRGMTLEEIKELRALRKKWSGRAVLAFATPRFQSKIRIYRDKWTPTSPPPEAD